MEEGHNGVIPSPLCLGVDGTNIDYGMGNIGSLENMVEKVGGKAVFVFHGTRYRALARELEHYAFQDNH